jgi:LysR family transcriptional regulator for metE and metH
MDVVGLPLIKTWHVVRRTDKRLLPSAEAMYRFWVEHGGDYLPTISGRAD